MGGVEVKADSNKKLGMQQGPIVILICFLGSEILTLLYKIEENYIVQHYSAIFKLIS